MLFHDLSLTVYIVEPRKNAKTEGMLVLKHFNASKILFDLTKRKQNRK